MNIRDWLLRQYPSPEPGPSLPQVAEVCCPRCGAMLDQPLGRAPYCIDELLQGVTGKLR